MRSGFQVRVCLTDSAQQFVKPALFEALTGQPCLQGAFEEPAVGRMAHIDWARQADAVVIAPATANTLNKLSAGVGDDMLTTIALATSKPIIVAPAMNPQMYANEATQASLTVLQARGVFVVEPTEGDVACGENGQGKLASITEIVSAVMGVVGRARILEGKHVLITSGPTREAIDQVRYISNRSSGKMGAALARAALLLGARVTVVTGPTQASLPLEATVERVQTAIEMRDAVMKRVGTVDVFVGAAAVADYRAKVPLAGKMRRTSDDLCLVLTPNPDIIAEFAQADPRAMVVGFAAEPSGDLAEARAKIQRKGLYAVAANDVSRNNIGFDSDQNELVLVKRDGSSSSSGLRSKLSCAIWLLENL
jgi:phosphopantothenoylcysteine decarboxylase/phosphopantothenate--cysteine ligase